MKILIDDLFYLYEKDGAKVVALRGLHLSINSGECVVIKGPNGSGKSTLVKILTGFLSPSAGRVMIDGKDISQIDPLELRRRIVASIDQRGNLLPDLTINANLALACALASNAEQDSKILSSQILENHGLIHLAPKYPQQLSAGERQLCALLAAIATKPTLLVADEPSGELDDAYSEKMYALLRSLAGETTVILVTHDFRAEKIADRIFRIRDGRISAQWKYKKKETPVIDPFGWMQVQEIRSNGRKVHRSRSGIPNRERQLLLAGIDLSVAYDERLVFTNLNIEASEGEFIALTGSSGSGKTTLLKVLSGMQDPSQGEVRIMGNPLSDLSREMRTLLRAKMLDFLAQGDSPVAEMALVDYLHNLEGEEFQHFWSRRDRSLSTFSGGERARIELLRLFAIGKRILLLDEPTSQLDERQSGHISELILKHVKHGGMVIASTRDEALLANATRIIALGVN